MRFLVGLVTVLQYIRLADFSVGRILVDLIGPNHRRRIKTEDKTKVVTIDCGAELIYFLAELAILHQDDLKNRIKCTRTI